METKKQKVVKLLTFSIIYWGMCTIVMIISDNIVGIDKYSGWFVGALMSAIYWQVIYSDIFQLSKPKDEGNSKKYDNMSYKELQENHSKLRTDFQ